jgi:hypothetical protein
MTKDKIKKTDMLDKKPVWHWHHHHHHHHCASTIQLTISKYTAFGLGRVKQAAVAARHACPRLSLKQTKKKKREQKKMPMRADASLGWGIVFAPIHPPNGATPSPFIKTYRSLNPITPLHFKQAAPNPISTPPHAPNKTTFIFWAYPTRIRPITFVSENKDIKRTIGHLSPFEETF